MKQITLFTIAIAMAFVSCKKEDEVLPPEQNPTETYGEVAFQMHFISDGEEVVMDETQQLNGMEVVFNRIQFYIHDVTFFADNMVDSVQMENAYWLAGLENTHLNLGEVQMHHIHMMKFKLGVDPVINAQSETEFLARPAGDPLAAQNPPMHWSWNADSGYKFAVYEGSYNAGANEFVYHCATDALLRETEAISVHMDLEVESTNEIHLTVNLTEVFSGVDITTTSTAHGAQPTNEALMNHLAGAFSVME